MKNKKIRIFNEIALRAIMQQVYEQDNRRSENYTLRMHKTDETLVSSLNEHTIVEGIKRDDGLWVVTYDPEFLTIDPDPDDVIKAALISDVSTLIDNGYGEAAAFLIRHHEPHIEDPVILQAIFDLADGANAEYIALYIRTWEEEEEPPWIDDPDMGV